MENTYVIRFVDRDSKDWDIYLTIKTDKNLYEDILPRMVKARKDWEKLPDEVRDNIDEFNYVARKVLSDFNWTETRIENVGW